MHICISALAESSSGRCGNFLCYCWMMLRVDGCLNEDPGPLPGPRYLTLKSKEKISRSKTVYFCSSQYESKNIPCASEIEIDVVEACADKEEGCAGWASENYCTTQRDLMSYYCPATCGFCNAVQEVTGYLHFSSLTQLDHSLDPWNKSVQNRI